MCIRDRARVVYAIEQHAHLTAGPPLPDNLIVIIGDARALPFPPVDVAVLLMRHCRHFALYRRKLAATGFRPGPPAELTPELAETIFEVDDCPECYHGRNSYRLSRCV